MTILRQPWVPVHHNYFYQIPDGERPFERFFFGLKVPVGIGLALGWTYHISRHPDFHNVKTTGRMLYTAFPFLGLGFFYCSGTFIAGQFRKKEDEWNHVIGVLTAAPLVRKLLDFRSTFVVVTYAALLVSFFKHTAMENKKTPMEPILDKGGAGCGFDWYTWSQNKPADAGYLTYSLFK